MAGKTVREAISSLAKAQINRFGSSPFHRQGDLLGGLFSELERQLKAMEKTTVGRKAQKAITPAFLRCLALLASHSVINNAKDHAVDLLIAFYFFAMRSCEFVHTLTPGQTKIITLGCITFFSSDQKELKHSHPNLIKLAVHVRVKFEDQKNGDKFDFRSQRRTGDPTLCPVLRFIRIVQRIRRFVPRYNK